MKYTINIFEVDERVRERKREREREREPEIDRSGKKQKLTETRKPI